MTAPATDSLMDEVFSELKVFVADEFKTRFDAFARAMDDRIKALPVREVKGEAGKDGPTLEQVAQLVKAEVALMPRPKDGEAGKSVDVQDVLPMLKALVEAIPKPSDGIDGQRGSDGAKGDQGEKGEAGQRGEKGDPGESGKPGDAGEPGAKGETGTVGEKGATGLNGKDGAPGDRGERGEVGMAGKDGSPGQQGEKGLSGDPGERGLQGERGEVGLQGKDGAPGLNGKDGADGINGKDGAPGLNGKDGADGLQGKDGAPGERGIDGKSFTIDDARQVLEGEVAKWALDFERRAGDTLQKAIDRMPSPRDGKDGSDGRDGVDALGFDDVIAEKTGDRTVAIVFKSGAREKRFEFAFPVALDAGVYKSGAGYEAGDGVTYGGSFWIAQRDTSQTPGNGPDWRLAVRAGRDRKGGES